jgi:hypothetical protein
VCKVGATYAAADHNPVYIVTPLTVELWARVNGRADVAVLLSNEPRNSRTHWELYAERETGRFAVGLPGFDPPQVVTQADIVDDQWHHVAFAFDGEQVALYVDGKESARRAVRRVKPFPDTGPLNFGYQLGVSPHPDTTIDEVRISRIVRPITGVPDKPFAADADTIGLWHFDEDARAYERAGFADASATRNPARLKDAKVEGLATNGGFDNTVGGRTRWQDMDFGPFFSSTITPPLNKANVTHKAVSIQLGKERKHFVTFDTELLRMSAAWEGEFVKIFPGREGLGNHPEMGGKPVFSTGVGPGWIVGDPAAADAWSDPRPNRLGPLPRDRGRYKGLHPVLHLTVLSYEVAGTEVLEFSEPYGYGLVRSFHIGASSQPMATVLCEVPGAAGAPATAGVVGFVKDGRATQAACANLQGEAEVRVVGSKIVLVVPPHDQAVICQVLLTNTDLADSRQLRQVYGLHRLNPRNAPILKTLDLVARNGGPARYPDLLVTKGQLGKSDGPYAVDTLTAPDDNPQKLFLRFGGLDFFANGDLAVCSVSGDVWVVSGVDDKLEQIKWRRFATGLFQPLGLKVVDDQVYVLGRDQITKLHDLNKDGEADFYENFNNDGLVTTNGHAYVACLERDPAGNFYYIKCGDRTPHGGTVLRVSPDGKRLDVFATGVRNANGLGMGPAGVLSFADNQGDWVPATRIDLVTRPMQFLGYAPMSKTPTPPTDPGKPVVWLPQNVDNSAGSQVAVVGDRWGLPAGSMLHTSYGQAALLHVMPQFPKLPDGTEVAQAAAWRFPLTFATGIMRGAFRPQDGQLYVCGLRGWQTAGTKDGAIQRVRYTGKPLHQPAAFSVHRNGIKLTFTCELDEETAADAGSWSVIQWNYRWGSEYGSKHWSAKDPQKQGYDTLEVKRATLLPDGKSVFLEVDGLGPVMQMRVSCNVDAKDGTEIRTDLYNTIHAVGPKLEVPE